MSLTGQTLKQRKDEGIVATTATDTALLITQEQDGSVAKPIELKNLVTDRKDTILAQELPETLSGITLAHNPLRAKPVGANDDNTKAYAGLPVLPSNTAVAVDLKTGTKKSTAVKVAGYLANSISFNFAFKHQSPSVTTARVIANLLLGTDIVKPVLTLTDNSLVIKDFATVGDADTTGVTLATRTLTVGKTYNYVLKYSGDTDGAGIIELYENNIPIYKNTSITYNAEYIASVLANVALEVALEEQWIRKDVFNYALTPDEVSLLWNSGRPDRAVLPDYMKWGSNTELVNNGNFSQGSGNVFTGWILGAGGSSDVVEDTVTFGSRAIKLIGDSSNSYVTIYQDCLVVDHVYNVSLKVKGTAGKSILLSNFSTYRIDLTGEIQDISFIATTNDKRLVIKRETLENGEAVIDDVSVIQLGSVASYTAKGLITDSTGKCTSWETDKKIETGIDDSLTATITGTPNLQLIQAEETEGQGLVDSIYKTITTAPMSANGLIGTVPMGWAIDEVLIEKTLGSTSNSIVIRVDSTSGTEIGTCDVLAFADSDDDLYTTAMTKKRLSNTASKDVYISGISAGTYVAILRIKKI